MKKEYKKIAFLLLNWNGIKDTIVCIDSILKFITNPKIIVVDNGSENSEADALKEKYGNKIELISNSKNLGFCGGNNVGFRAAKKSNVDYLILLNNDAVLTSTWRDFNLDFASDPALAGVTILDFDQKTVQSTGINLSLCTGISHNISNGLIYSPKQKYPHGRLISGTCFVINMNFFKDDDTLFDEDYFAYYEETDLSFRVLKRGGKIEFSDFLTVAHKGSASTNKVSGFGEFQSIRNRFMIEKKQASAYEKIVFILLQLPYLIYKIILLTAQPKNFKPFFRGYFLGLLFFFGIKRSNIGFKS